MTEEKAEVPVAVWYFVGATFAGVAPGLFLNGAEWWVKLLFVPVALGLIVAGFVHLRRETGSGKNEGEQPPTE
ncbi:hypothetical protein [Microbacterium oleivorans]|uniref:Uncharacterized protein n=1 Tax=Microbacterium oleivorans TaxID=273677 RepID=A0A177KCB4_9MICO|nr:hypothetical protein [Microbacterium oleivorans]OAH51049.1 hypothetical protein AYL44_01840 [Microbacterium oleivorans]